MSIKEAQVVGRVESRCVMRSERLLFAFQRPLIHRLRLLQPAPIRVEAAQQMYYPFDIRIFAISLR